ncbi:GNAT family N-acetyltransferase [Paeniglutamicibacter antarcticus]|uniref:GNAT family N-acetyltransferase n=1 Tax=Arthrobacter terrae TaxID=2935737 RepID=A0A931CT84_9MICC|nr:GNAT family N-acetyltransferase [Arthrobacter terrae]MBG0739358.1 GNAT family N-acetyltransferase [Arthrobacter terrae]
MSAPPTNASASIPSDDFSRQAAQWIAWNEANYAEHGYGLWIVETLDGQFPEDCGLTWQDVNGRMELEVGYHLLVGEQSQGYATEAAAACKDFARDELNVPLLVAIIHPDNGASRRVAEKIGMRHIEDDHGGAITARAVLGARLDLP